MRASSTANAEKATGCGCGCMLIVIILNALLGAWSFNYCLWALTSKQIPTIWAFVCGLFLGEITIPLGIVFAILHSCGVPMPFYTLK